MSGVGLWVLEEGEADREADEILFFSSPSFSQWRRRGFILCAPRERAQSRCGPQSDNEPGYLLFCCVCICPYRLQDMFTARGTVMPKKIMRNLGRREGANMEKYRNVFLDEMEKMSLV